MDIGQQYFHIILMVIIRTGWIGKHKSTAIIWTIHSSEALFDFVVGRRLYSHTTPCRRANIRQRSSYSTANHFTCKLNVIFLLENVIFSFLSKFDINGEKNTCFSYFNVIYENSSRKRKTNTEMFVALNQSNRHSTRLFYTY